MLELNEIKAVGKPFYELIETACRKELSCLPERQTVTGFAEVFNDADLITTCFKLFENNLNVSKTAKSLYMHRNTLIYRIGKIKRITGLCVTDFADAVTFVIMYRRYRQGRSGRQ